MTTQIPKLLFLAAWALLLSGNVAHSANEPGAWEKAKAWTQQAYEETLNAIDAPSDDAFNTLWDEITPKLADIISLQDAHEALPDSSWFSQDKSSSQQDINALLTEAARILDLHNSHATREKILTLEENIAEIQDTIDQHRQQRITAPKTSIWHKTEQEHADTILALQAEIKHHREKINLLKRAYQQEMTKMGLHLTEQQLDFLLRTVIGAQAIEISVAFNNVKVLTEKLELLTDQSAENIHAAHKYYGMYTVLLKVLDTLYQESIDTIDAQYLPKIESIVEQTHALQAKTHSIQPTSNNRSIIQANLAAQHLTLKAADLYQRYLQQQRADIEKAQRKLADNIALADNTYQTVRLSGELVDMMRSGRKLFDVLVTMQAPTLRTFQNRALQNEFTHLTKRITALE